MGEKCGGSFVINKISTHSVCLIEDSTCASVVNAVIEVEVYVEIEDGLKCMFTVETCVIVLPREMNVIEIGEHEL